MKLVIFPMLLIYSTLARSAERDVFVTEPVTARKSFIKNFLQDQMNARQLQREEKEIAMLPESLRNLRRLARTEYLRLTWKSEAKGEEEEVIIPNSEYYRYMRLLNDKSLRDEDHFQAVQGVYITLKRKLKKANSETLATEELDVTHLYNAIDRHKPLKVPATCLEQWRKQGIAGMEGFFASINPTSQ